MLISRFILDLRESADSYDHTSTAALSAPHFALRSNTFLDNLGGSLSYGSEVHVNARDVSWEEHGTLFKESAGRTDDSVPILNDTLHLETPQ